MQRSGVALWNTVHPPPNPLRDLGFRCICVQMPVKTLPVTIGHATPHLFWLWAQARLQTKKTLNYKLSIMKLFAQDDKANEAVVDEAIETLLSTAKADHAWQLSQRVQPSEWSRRKWLWQTACSHPA